MSRSDKSGGKSGDRFGGARGDDSSADQDPFASLPDIDERLADWVDGTMSPRDRERFEAEMRVSPHLRDQVADYEGTVASIREALHDETHETHLADRVMSSLAQEANGVGKRSRPVLPLLWAAMSAAALLGITVLIDSWGGTAMSSSAVENTAAQFDAPAASMAEKDVSNPSANSVVVASPDAESSLEEILADEVAGVEALASGAQSKPAGQEGVGPEIAAPASAGPAGPTSGGRMKRGAPDSAARSPGGPAVAGVAPSQSKEVAVQESAELGAANAEASKPVEVGATNIRPGRVTDPDDSLREIGNALYGAGNRPAGGGQGRGYLLHLSEKKSDVEVLPLVTLDGFAVRFELTEETEQRLLDQSRVEFSAGLSGFGMGLKGETQKAASLRFFDIQMRPSAEWSEADSQWYARHAVVLKPLEVGLVSIGGLQLFAVGPAGSGAKVDGQQSDTSDGSGDTKAKSEAVSGTNKPVTPGAWDANGGGVEQRDWLVVGSKSEVAELLVTLRKYSDDVNTRTCRAGEVSLAKSESKLSSQILTGGRDSATKSDNAAGIAETSQTNPSASNTSSPAATAELVERVVIRFRVRW